jgi:hypothetical protein
MRRCITLAVLAIVALTANAQSIVTLVCDGTNAEGAKKTVTIEYNENEGWAKDDDTVIVLRGGVTAKEIRTLSNIVDRQTGEFITRRPSSPRESYKGTCEKMARKF